MGAQPRSAKGTNKKDKRGHNAAGQFAATQIAEDPDLNTDNMPGLDGDDSAADVVDVVVFAGNRKHEAVQSLLNEIIAGKADGCTTPAQRYAALRFYRKEVRQQSVQAGQRLLTARDQDEVTVLDEASGARHTLSWGRKEVYDEEGCRRFLLGSADRKSVTISDIATISRNMWRDSHWHPRSLREMGIDLGKVCEEGPWTSGIEPNTAYTPPETHQWRNEVQSSLFDSERVDEAQILVDMKRYELQAGLAIADVEKTMLANYDAASGNRSFSAPRNINGYAGQEIASVKYSRSRKAWDADKIYDHIKDLSDGDPQVYARLMLQARPRGGYRAKQGNPTIAPYLKIRTET